jgi:hypothetical protein
MKSLDLGGIPLSLGEIINFKYHLDLVRKSYQQITFSFHRSLMQTHLNVNAQQEQSQNKYLDDIGTLFFSETPYKIEPSSTKFFGDMNALTRTINVPPQKADLRQYLCKGNSLGIDPYIVITTKVRELDRAIFFPLSSQLWGTLQSLSQKYKIVVLGEREVEMRKEYMSWTTNNIYGLYEQIISNIPADRIIDLTVPSLGNTASDLSKIQQDCLIMNQAKATITIGIGGNSGLSTASSNLAIGYRNDNNYIAERIYKAESARVCITRDWNRFISKLNELG